MVESVACWVVLQLGPHGAMSVYLRRGSGSWMPLWKFCCLSTKLPSTAVKRVAKRIPFHTSCGLL
jgi:hypothetical protein